MAFASSRIGTQEAFITPCDLCEDEEDVNWFCKDCIQNLCERCKKGHLKIVTCRNHRLVSILEGVVTEKRNASNLCLQSLHPQAFSVTKGKRFNAGMTSHELIVDMIGKTESHLDIKESHETGEREGTNSFELHIIKKHRLKVQNKCHCICTSPDGSIWLGGFTHVYKMCLCCYSFLHKIPNTFMDGYGISNPFYSLSCEYIASLQSGGAIASYDFSQEFKFSKNSIVKLITSNGYGVDLNNPSGSTCDIAITNHDEVVVLVKKQGWFSSTYSLVTYSKEGIHPNTIPLDNVVSGICINNDGNFVISDKKSNHLTTLDSKGAKLKKIQISTSGLRRMTCDRFGNILGIRDDKTIHLIRDDGEVERSFTVGCEHYINDICFDNNNRLLILVDGHVVVVAEYLQRK